MKIAPQAASAPLPPVAKTNEHNALNPAKQAKAAEPGLKGAEFGHLVASFAHARHAPPPAALTPPIVEPSPAIETPTADETTAETAPTDETAPTEATVPQATDPVGETAQTAPPVAGVAPPAAALVADIETQLLADLLANTEPGDTLNLIA